jgi:dienelactone hydrolase
MTTAILMSVVIGLFVGQLSRAQTPLTAQQEKATAEIQEYFRRTTQRLADAALADVKTLDDWQRLRPVLREQLLEMLGLSPVPERTDLQATVTGSLEHDGFIVEKLHFQSRPGLYVTANFYRPKQVHKPLPTILYLCGHGNVKIDGVSYGSKASYQHHPAWFAREGYCCLILDTLQLGEIEGLHHGTYREGMWWWLDRGYTPAGVEAWNAVRALDYLETRPEVDMKRIGVTGRSGGGAYTWWLAAIDDRPACLIPVAGITDLENHVVDGCIEGHCDCMYMVNTYGWDFATVAALAAPRPLLFSNSDKDTIFPLTGVVRTHAKLKKIYELYKASDKLGLLITEGPHKDTQELQVPAFRWMNRWLQGKDEPITRVADKPLDPKELKVFKELPADQSNTAIHESFVRQAEPSAPPTTLAEWQKLREVWLADLKEKSFRGWPKSPPPPGSRIVLEKEAEGLRLQVLDFLSDENLSLPVYLISSSETEKVTHLVVDVVDNAEWRDWVSDVAPAFSDVIPGADATQANRPGFATFKKCHPPGWVRATVVPRGVGPVQWNPDNKRDNQIQRRFVLLGKSLDEGRVWDVRRAIEVLKAHEPLKDAHVQLRSVGASAGIALYAGVFTAAVDDFELHRATSMHRDGPHLLNVSRMLDLPQSMALAFPRPVILYDTDPAAWRWTQDVANLYDSGTPPLRMLLRGEAPAAPDVNSSRFR